MMAFLIIPFMVLGVVAILLALWIASRPRFKKQSQNPERPSSATISLPLLIFAAASGVLGLVFSIYGFDRSLWLDEFGTLWTIDGDLRQVIQRAFSFQGQSPFYYLIVWAFKQVFGVSEITLRLPSLFFGFATVCEVYLLGTLVGNRRIGITAASLLWLSPTMAKVNADARPYALALFMTATLFYGFIRSTQFADHRGRWLFIAGGAGLFSTHYLLALAALGVAIAYFCLPPLRARYAPRQFVTDIGVQLLLVAWALPQLAQLWSRRAELSWLGDPNYLAFFELAGPFIIAGLVYTVTARIAPISGLQQHTLRLFWISLIVPIALLEILGGLGVNLLERRYMIPLSVPAVIIAAIAFEWTPRRIVVIPLSYWLLFTGMAFAMNFRAYETFSTTGFQNWRQASACLDILARRDNNPAILFRSGFVEEDLRTKGGVPPSVVLAPLYGTGALSNTSNMIPLTYSWLIPGNLEYMSRAVEPALREVSVFYFLSCANCFNQATGKYPDLFRAWVESQFPNKFLAQPVDAGKGITLIRFADKTQEAKFFAATCPYVGSTTGSVISRSKIRPSNFS